MDLKEAIYKRRSVRQFTDAQVEKEKLDTLFQAAVQAPSATNAQPWAFAVIRDVELLKNYSDGAKKILLDNIETIPYLEKYKSALENRNFNIFYNANCLVIIYAKEIHPAASGDCCLAAQNLMLTAHSIGLGTCWIGFALKFLNEPEIMQALNVPQGYQAVAPIIVGYPKKALPDITKNDPVILFEK
ncbi:MAG: nitroreductase [Sporomusaceae bacterium]|jgi:nitroreductase|nr:nitroreductase [Sporomusaceae bacterium]